MIHTIEETITRLRQIQLDSDHSPEQIVRMILAGGTGQSLYNIQQGVHQSALEFLCRETCEIRNYPIRGGIVHRDEKGPFFNKGTSKFPGNEFPNEFLGILAEAGVNFKTAKVVTDRGQETTLIHLAERAMQTYKLNGKQTSDTEPGWSLILFSFYPGIVAEWKNETLESCSVENILGLACGWPYGSGSYLGTRVLKGISIAVSQYCMEKDLEPAQLEGIWKQGWNYIEGAVRRMRKNQREDGSIPRYWHKEEVLPRNPGQLNDFAKDLVARRLTPGKAIVFPTAYCLDAIAPLSIFLAEDREWLDGACYILAQTIESNWLEVCRDVSSLAHAVRALKLLMD